MTAVIDSSMAIEYLVGQCTPAERAAVVSGTHAPGLLDIEVTHTLRSLLRGGKIDIHAADQARIDLAELRLRRHSDHALLGRAWELRDHCSTYDGLYVALAEKLDLPLLTYDNRLIRGVKGLVSFAL